MLKTSTGEGSDQTLLTGLERRLTGSVPEDSAIPGPVRRAVRFMLAGGGVTLLLGVILIVATIVDKNALTNSSGKKLSDSEFTSGVVGAAIAYLIQAAIWVIMARMNRSGHNWARILASVFCAISTYLAFQLVNSLHGGETIPVIGIVYIVFNLIIWVLGVIAIALVWRGESSAYFKARSASR
jgi:predicted permease